MNYKVTFATENDKARISELRKAEYAKANGYSVNLETLNWSQTDDQSYVMVLKKDNKILATMRGEVINDLSVVEKKIECPWDFDMKLECPTLLLSRAATESECRAQGFNLVLRYFFIEFAKKNNLATVIGTFVSKSPREQSLQKMGYCFFENKLGWQESTYRSLRPVQVVALDLKSAGEQAIEYCHEMIPELQTQFQFEAPVSTELRYVRGL